jgi:hypothetical protein
MSGEVSRTLPNELMSLWGEMASCKEKLAVPDFCLQLFTFQ